MKWFLKKLTGIGIINFFFLLFAVTFIPVQKPQVAQKAILITSIPSNTQTANSTPTPVQAQDIFTELKNHNTKSNCWIEYKGHIYNITSVFGAHPGGDDIMLKYCGKDATSGFDNKEKSPAVPHSAGAASLLSQYLVQ